MPLFTQPNSTTTAPTAWGALVDAALAALLAFFAESGQITFPATQSPSSNANTLDDYEEGTWTPAFTFATVGNLSIAYSAQTGFYIKIGQLVSISWTIITSTFTHSTSSGTGQVTGAPFAALNTSGYYAVGALQWQGITKANYTHICSSIAQNATTILMEAAGSAQANAQISAADMPTSGTVIHRGQLTYRAAA